ncbi:50S ribosomal protein L21 [Candidatus Uhrbacteria bacterium]|nr:50S ribosomal protein L21 [Candidatus Uhrbacteria bacterium]
MIAVVKTGGKQYKVREGEVLKIESLPQKEGEVFELEVLLVSDEEAQQIKIGAPLALGARVEARLLEQGRGRKVSVMKFKPKVRYKKNVGHRQPYSKIRIEKITL